MHACDVCVCDPLRRANRFDHAVPRDRLPSGRHKTRSDRRCRDALSALISRRVIGRRRDRPLVGTVT